MYESTILALGSMALLMLVQLLIADVVSIKFKHLPGSSVPTDHNSLLFRSTRTAANTNESIAIFVLAILFCIFSNASPNFTAYAAWGFVGARLTYAGFYYSNRPLLRSLTFVISLLFLLALLLIGLSVWV
ncbi:MAG: MAPEG family protein [Arenicella sp.]|nr:MAPEG family protein [Arenicella sp.]